MGVDDIPAVEEIDRVSFPSPMRQGLYQYELTRNTLAHYQVVTAAAVKGNSVAGYAGYWTLADEAHVSSIAVAPQWRRNGLGELLLRNILLLACHQLVDRVTLEVRLSNEPAQRLYHKLGFEVTGRRKRYYRDTGEDAWIMTLELPTGANSCRSLQAAGDDLCRRLRPPAAPANWA